MTFNNNLLLWITTLCSVYTYGLQGDPCEKLPDGKHSTRDVFQYLTCNQKKGTYTQCPQHNMYDPLLQVCKPIANYNVTTFCSHRSTSNWRNPWNCHTYIACVYERSYVLKCALPGLIYNPELDQCVNAGEMPCREEKKLHKKETNPCELKVDGKYATRDIFQYLQCTNNTGTYVPCVRQIFNPILQECIDYSKVSKENFCKVRPNSNYNNPWNCHKFITCSNGNLYVFNCSTPELVYDPKNDSCKHPDEAVCKQIDDPCAEKDDGRYSTRDVFQYMVCKQGHASYVSCGENIYDPCSKTCVPSSKVNMDTFCKCRGNSNYMDPWNCHKYITCSNNVHYLFNCSTPELVYDPVTDKCLHPDEQQCKQVKGDDTLSTKLKVDYRFGPNEVSKSCSSVNAGFYAIRDVSKILVCVFGRTFYLDCTPHSFYIPGQKSCSLVKNKTPGPSKMIS